MCYELEEERARRVSVGGSVGGWTPQREHLIIAIFNLHFRHGDGQLKVFYVGGPNQRKDFHIEEGEEFFYMVKGDMNLITLQNGAFKDVIIKEGEVFQLPGKVPHSPQRFSDTVGLVVERERVKSELDCLRYYVEGTTETLFEKWFYCSDLAVQLQPVIKEFFMSQQYKTGKPVPGTISENPPWVPDALRIVEEPFSLAKWLNKHRAEVDQEGEKRLFDLSYQSDVVALGRGSHHHHLAGVETWLWQLEGESEVTIGEDTVLMRPQESMLVRSDTPFTHTRKEGSLCLSVVMDPNQKKRAFTHLK
ncbi:3-hydroxyanthranilate 3,4-dioxygenase isoform X1 [Procambarus clarkii]|uniref:3-hydroxyanthranilate 3,4-dioxygenase isoform X1 n=1 Tax=Procambarus clarkii TaxID=6728 RepID=UPI001E6713AF|nr:3-hydroxyanthranilate 3,4-dioxygenase-like isoform X1 [Procambarus clarkii]